MIYVKFLPQPVARDERKRFLSSLLGACEELSNASDQLLACAINETADVHLTVEQKWEAKCLQHRIHQLVKALDFQMEEF